MPEELHARWVAEALYRMWDQGVSLVTWFQVRDQAWGSGPFQSGLYFRGQDGIASDKPKLALTAFRFPFVAFRDSKTKQVDYWGRSPRGRATGDRRSRRSPGSGVTCDGSPEFERDLPRSLRAALLRKAWFARGFKSGKDEALPFSLVVPPDRPGCAWGTC